MPPISISSVGGRQPQLQRRQQRMATGQELCSVGIVAQQIDRLGERRRANIIECCGDHWAAPVRACCTADQTRGGVIGMSRCLIPNGDKASSTA